MSNSLAIIGAGDLGLQIAHICISDGHFERIVFFDDYATTLDIAGFSVLGKINSIMEQYDNGAFDQLIIGIGYKHLKIRKELFEKFESKIPFATIVHSSCFIDSSAVIAPGVILYPNCCIDANTYIASNSVINLACTISHDCSIGAHSFFAPRIAIAGFVRTGEMCFIGINTTISDSISIIEGTQTGAGSVVINNIDISGVYVGNPVKKIR